MRVRVAVLSTLASCLLALIGAASGHAAEACVKEGREAPYGVACQPSVGVRLEAKEEYAADEEGEGCRDLIEYDAWATENPAESLPERQTRETDDFGECGWPASGGATGLVEDKLLERGEWAAFTGPPAHPEQGRLSIQLNMEPSCVYAGKSSPWPTFHEQCLAPGTIKEGKGVSVSKKDYETMRANLEDAVKYWCGLKPSEENPSKECKRKALKAPECKLEEEAKGRGSRRPERSKGRRIPV